MRYFSFFLLVLCFTLQGFAEEKPRIKNRTLLITGCARSGTTFITKFLRANQLDVGHEYERSYGIVSWTMTGDSDKSPWGPGANHYYFTHVFHQVRHPLKTIASAGNEPPVSWEYVRQFIPQINRDDPKIVKGAKYWYYWNLLAEKKAEWTYRIEDLHNQIGEMERRLGEDLDASILEKLPKNINTRGYSDVYTWEDLRQAVDEDLYRNIVSMAVRYGYEIDQEF